MGGVRRFRKEFAGSTDDAIRPKKGERPPRVATPGTRPGARGGPGLARRFLEGGNVFPDGHGAVTDLREERMVRFALFFVLGCPITYVLVGIIEAQRSEAIAAS